MRRPSCLLALAIGLFSLAPLASIELRPELGLSSWADLNLGLRTDGLPWTATTVSIGALWAGESDEMPIGAAVGLRQSLFRSRIPLELDLAGELRFLDPDAGFLVLPCLGLELGLRFTLFKQDFLVRTGLWTGSAEYEESYEGRYVQVRRISALEVPAIRATLVWRDRAAVERRR